MDLTGKAALVTGASRGIGRAIAVRLASAGAVVALLREGGRIITISSLVTRIVPPEIAYVMSKGALDVMTRALAVGLGSRGITVNAVAPGLTATDTFPHVRDNPEDHPEIAAATALGRIGQPGDIADVVAFLASHEARWITGQILDATGGQFLRPTAR